MTRFDGLLLPFQALPRVRDLPFPASIHDPNYEVEDITMSSVCDVCAKKPIFGKRLSHSHRRSNRRWNPNVQKVRAIVDGSPRRINVCTSCIKAGKVQKP